MKKRKFSKGEVAPSLSGRADLAAYRRSVKALKGRKVKAKDRE